MSFPEPIQPAVAGIHVTCLECGRNWADASERWRLYLLPGDPPTCLVYCPTCAEREFS